MANLRNLEKHTGQFIQELMATGGPPIYKLPFKDAREVLEDLQAKKTPKLPVDCENLMILDESNQKLSLRIIRPKNSIGNLPVILYFHGGGWILGSQETHDRLIREIACGSNAAVVFVNYTPSPEAKFPKAIEQAYSATQYIAEHGKKHKLDPSRLAVFGDSVGGNMAAAVTLLAKERGGPKISYQVLCYPVTDANFNTASYNEFAEGPWLTKAAMQWFWNAYAPNITMRKNPLASPLQASLEQLKHLPPALIITDENDVLRDEGEAYAHKLMQAGVEVTVIRYLGAIHDFMLLNPLSHTPATKSAITLATSHLQKVFSARKIIKHKKAA